MQWLKTKTIKRCRFQQCRTKGNILAVVPSEQTKQTFYLLNTNHQAGQQLERHGTNQRNYCQLLTNYLQLSS